jgi:hypothetical protein
MAAPGFRAALYWTPPPDDILAVAGKSWLGRDAEGNLAIAQPVLPGIADATEAPRLYGFHATLRPPMRLATGWAEFCAAAEEVARTITPFDLPALEVAEMSGFLALRETAPCPALQALADLCVRLTEPHRLAPDPGELARRRAQRLTPRQDQMLVRWGYPYVMAEWRFHMTLTRRLAASERDVLRPAAEDHFANALKIPRRVEALAIFTQAGPGEPFLVGERISLGT